MVVGRLSVSASLLNHIPLHQRGRMGGMRFRKLRIAWSVVCGVACVLLIVLWVRSYSQTD